MKPRHRRAGTRALVTALLVLVVSPVTAPFLTFDLADWLAGGSSHNVTPGVQSKKAADDLAPPVVAAAGCALIPTAAVRQFPLPATTVRSCRPAEVPLRI